MRKFDPRLMLLLAAIAMLVPFGVKGIPGPTIWAAIGSIICVLGVLSVGRPVLRQGYYAWRVASQVIDGGYADPSSAPPEWIEKERQEELDALAVQVIGPALIIGGTLLNGFSGFAA